MPRRWKLATFAFALGAPTLGCDGRPPSGPVPVYPVTGRITYRGRPVPGALVVLHPAATKLPAPTPAAADLATTPVPTGKTDADGRFQIHTYVGADGAPVGDYRVAVVLAGLSERRNVMIKNSALTPSVTIPAKFADPAQSGLSATVRPDENVIPAFEL